MEMTLYSYSINGFRGDGGYTRTLDELKKLILEKHGIEVKEWGGLVNYHVRVVTV